MGKQAVGVYYKLQSKVYDTFSHVQQLISKDPAYRYKNDEILNADKLPNGINVIVAIATYGGYKSGRFNYI